MGSFECTRRTRGWRLFQIVLSVALLLGIGMAVQPVYAAPSQKTGAAAKAVNPEARNKAKKFLQQAAQLRAKGKNIEAELILQKARQADPNWTEVYVASAKCYEALGNYDVAVDNWKKATAIAPNKIEYQRSLAHSATKAFNNDVAEAAWKEVAKINPQDLEAHNMLASIYLEKNQYDEAARCNHDALDINGEDAQANYIKAMLAIHQQDYAEAKKDLDKLMAKLPPNHPLRSKCADSLRDVKLGQEKQYKTWAIYAGIPALGVILGLIVCFIPKRKAAAPDPVIDLDTASEDTVCRYLLRYCSQLFELPRGFCWSMSFDGRRLVLQMSQLIGETSGVAQIGINGEFLDKWLKARGTAPFLYEAELDDANFKQAFDVLIKEINDIRIDVGIPIVREGKLMAFVLLGGSRSTRKDKVCRRFNNYAERVQGLAEKSGLALERIMQRDSRVKDIKTGMWNREYYEKSFGDLLRGCHVANIPMSVFMMRMDQLPEFLENKQSDETAEVLYNVGQLVVRGINGEMNVDLCHLDNGVFVLLAPERDAKEAERLANTLKNCFDKTSLLGPDIRTTGSVAYCVVPDDGNDPVLLRSMLSKTFHDLSYNGGNGCKRVTKISDEAPKEEEAPPQEELIIRRTRRPGDNSKPTTYQPFGKARITSNADIADLPDNSAPIRLAKDGGSNVVSLGTVMPVLVAAETKPAADDSKKVQLNVKGNIASASSTPDPAKAAANPGAEGNVKLLAMLEKKETPAGSPQSAQPEEKNDEGIDYKLDLQFDDDGVEVETQCCSQEVFEELIGFELEQALENQENCALVYLHIVNLEDIRSTGRTNYMKLRRELASLMRAFLREDIDIPGLVGEDDFAVFMTGSAKDAAVSLADRLNLTSPNLDAGGYNMVPSLGVAVIKSGENITAQELIARAKALANGQGIHYEE